MRQDKYRRMMQQYKGHAGPVTVAAVQGQIPNELFARLTGYELGLVMSAVNRAYHNGRAAEAKEECIWHEGGVTVRDGQERPGVLVPRSILNNLRIEHTSKSHPREYVTTYKLDAQEVC